MNEEMKELNDAIKVLNDHDGMRYQATIYFLSRMRDSDLQAITNFCIQQERERYKKIQPIKRTKED